MLKKGMIDNTFQADSIFKKKEWEKYGGQC